MAVDSEEVYSEFLRLGARLKAAWWVEDLTSQFRWARKRRILWFVSRPDKKAVAVVALAASKPALVLTGTDGVAALSTLLVEELRELPGDLAAADLARAIRWLTTGLPGKLMSPQLLEGSAPLAAFVPGASDERVRRFRELCSPPSLERDRDGEWRLSFRYLALKGDVEEWWVEGSAEGIRAARVAEASPPGVFHWPYE